VYTAKEVATVDWLSAGRVDFGIGVGWLREEFDALQVPWAARGARTDEYLDVLRSLWCEDPSSHQGTFYTLAPCSFFPKPVQAPHPPVHVGGESDAALRRTARHGQGWHTFNRTPDELGVPLARLDELLAAEGRTSAEITVTVSPYFKEMHAEDIERYAEAGADAVAVLIFAGSAAEIPAAFDALEPYLERARAC
jgi:probable F420-dependent oxidoreductase